MVRANGKVSAAMGKNDRFLPGIFQKASLGILLFDIDLRLVEANPAMSKTVGYSVEELKKLDITKDLVPPEDAQLLRQQVSLLVSKTMSSVQVQSRFKKKNGAWMVGELNLSLLPDAEDGSYYIIGLLNDITEKKYARSMLENSDKMHRLLAKDLISAQETERRSVVLELHDVIGGNLGAAKYLLEKMKIQGDLSEEIWDGLANKLDNLIVDTINEVQRLSTSLRPPGLDDMGILAALKWLVRKQNEIYTDSTTTLTCSIEESDIPAALKIVLFRVVQEALNNAAKHSQATLIEVTLAIAEGKLMLRITDNGIGCNPDIVGFSQENRGLGLHNMQSRTELSDGRMTIRSRADSGTIIHAEWDQARLAERSGPS